MLKLELRLGGKAYYGWESDDSPPPLPSGAPGSTDATYSIGLLAYGDFQGKLVVDPPFFVCFDASLEIGGAYHEDSKQVQFEMEFKIEVGVGFGGDVLNGSLMVGYDLTIEDGEIKNGLIVDLTAEADFKIIDVTVQGEFKGLWYDDSSHPPNKHARDMGGEIDINVDIGFIGIQISYEWQTTQYSS